MYSAAAVTPASDSNGSVPSSQRSGASSGDGLSLSGISDDSTPGAPQRIPTCGPYHLYAEHASVSAPSAARSSGRCGTAATASTEMRAPAACTAATIAASSGTVPHALDAAVTATQRVRSDSTASTAAAGSASVSPSGSAQRTVAPARSAAITHGRTLASWSSRVTTTSSPGASVRPTAADSRIVIAVIEGPNATSSGRAPSSRPAAARASSTHSSVACAAANAPPWFAPRPERIHASIAAIAESTICVPAGPSRRTHEPDTPGKRSRFMRARRGRAQDAHDDSPGVSPGSYAPARDPHQLRVVRVAQQRGCSRDVDPAHLVHLVVRHERGTAVLRLHQPVADRLRAPLVVVVADRRQLLAEPAAQADLLLDLAQRGRLPCLARVELALRQRPVVVARPVHDDELDRTAGRAAPDHAARRLDLGRLGIHAPHGRTTQT